MKKLLIVLLTISLFASCKDKTAKTDAVVATEEIAKTDPEQKMQEIAPKLIKGDAMMIDAAKSIVNWTGTKPTGQHTGTINLSRGALFSSEGKVTGGKIMLDMNSINCTDLSGAYKADLEAHLKGTKPGEENDFFNTTEHPLAIFDVTKVIEVKNSKTTHMAMGTLNIKGIVKPIGIPCDIVVTENSIHVTSKGFNIDRTQWGINFMSKSIFSNLKDKFINDKIELDLDILASK